MTGDVQVPDGDRTRIEYAWHDVTCTEGIECRSRDLHRLAAPETVTLVERALDLAWVHLRGCKADPVPDGDRGMSGDTTTPIPAEAIEVACSALDERMGRFDSPGTDEVALAISVAAPFLLAAERERIATAIDEWRPDENRADEPGNWKRGVRHARLAAARIARTRVGGSDE